jgi:hypothetical protein
MRSARFILPCLLVALLAAGCGPSFFKTKGRILKDGAPFHTGEGEGLRIFLVPIDPPKGAAFDAYAGEFNNDNGTFQIKGKDGNGVPPGKYRVTMQLMKNREDMFNGSLMGLRSPYTCEVRSSSDEVVVDLDQAKIQPAKGKKDKTRS